MARVLRSNILALAVANVAAAAALGFADPGVSSSLAFLRLVAPLPVWAVAFAVASVLLVARRHLAGHTVAVPLWSMFAIGAFVGVLGGTSQAPAASIVLAGLAVAITALHVNGMVFRRQEGRATRAAQRG